MGEIRISVLSKNGGFPYPVYKKKGYTFHAAAHFSLASGMNISVM